MGNLAIELGELDRGITLLEESVTLAREFGDKWILALVLQQLADGVRIIDDHERAWHLYEEGVQLFGSSGNRVGR